MTGGSKRPRRGSWSAQAATLIELLVVVSIIVLLIAIMMASFDSVRSQIKSLLKLVRGG
jgi:Tfp pilus assembly protein FimT